MELDMFSFGCMTFRIRTTRWTIRVPADGNPSDLHQ